MPDEWQGVYDAVRKGGSLSLEAQAIRNGAKVFDACQNIKGAPRKNCLTNSTSGTKHRIQNLQPKQIGNF
ncbi:MAG: type IV secretion system protein [Zoogloeaceae bacterium]|nr:type IV secretion system protein [Zoogloeaceae bacterium]